MRLTARRLTAEAFAPFGQVIPTRRPELGRRSPAAMLESRRPAAVPVLAVARIAPTPAPIRARVLERHPFSSQTFVPTDLSCYVLLVCPGGADGGPGGRASPGLGGRRVPRGPLCACHLASSDDSPRSVR